MISVTARGAVILLLSMLLLQPHTGFSQVASNDRRASAAVELLWSSDATSRLEAENEIVRFGKASVPPLLSLLGGLLSDMGSPHYERLGKDQGALSRHPQPERTFGSNITWRLINDVCTLLGELKAVEAVPLLLKVMEERPIMGLSDITAETRAIEAIGRPATPMVMDRFLEAARDESLALTISNPTDGQVAWARNVAKVETRVTTILELLGDETVIPILHGMADSSQAPRAAGEAKRLIEMLRFVK